MPDSGIWYQPLLAPPRGRTRQASSRNRDDRGGDWLGSRPREARQKRILLEPGEVHVMADLPGAGLITRIWMTTLWPLRWHALDDAVLRFYWDGEIHPSVEASLGDFFGAPFGGYRSYQSAALSITSGGFNCTFPMPFADGARLTVTNESGRLLDPVYYAVSYYELDEQPPADVRFHARWNRQFPTREGEPYVILDVDGSRGHFVGARLDMQAHHWWLRRPLSDMIFPYGMGFGMVEGMEHIYIDGEKSASIVGTGTEDYFNGAWYYALGRFSAPTYGCTVRDWIRGRISSYRYDVHAPVNFEKSIRVTIDHGIDNRMTTDYASMAYWYQPEPHTPWAPPPRPERRRHGNWIRNASQTVSVLATLVAGGWVGLRHIIRRRER